MTEHGTQATRRCTSVIGGGSSGGALADARGAGPLHGGQPAALARLGLQPPARAAQRLLTVSAGSKAEDSGEFFSIAAVGACRGSGVPRRG